MKFLSKYRSVNNQNIRSFIESYLYAPSVAEVTKMVSPPSIPTPQEPEKRPKSREHVQRTQTGERYSSCGVGSFGQTLGKQTSRVLIPHMDKILEMIKTIPLKASTPFNIGDYGTADGSASLSVIKEIVNTVRSKHGQEVELQVIYEDQEGNDFNKLFNKLQGAQPDPRSYLTADKVFPFASATNFYNQCAPTNYMHFIMAPVAVHWLSKPVVYQNSIYGFPEGNPEEIRAQMKQAADDWEQFLLMRSRELKKGGILVVTSPSMHVKGDDKREELCGNIFLRTLNTIWTDFRDRGIITDDEFLATNLGFSLNPLTLYTKPFEDPSSGVSKSGMKLMVAKDVLHPCVFYTTWKERRDKLGVDDSEEAVKMAVAAHRSWSEGSFKKALSEQRAAAEQALIINELYAEQRRHIENMDIDMMKNQVKFVYIVIQKT